MKAHDNVIKEYEDIRGEIKQKIELHNSLIMFMITTVVAVLAFAVQGDNSILYLLPFGIIIPTSMRITYYRTAMAKLSAYIIVYIENKIKGLNWETRNNKLINSVHNNIYDNLTISQYYEGMILSLICYLLYFFDYFKGKEVNLQTIMHVFVPFLFVLWEIVITKRIASFDKERNTWISKWKNLRDRE